MGWFDDWAKRTLRSMSTYPSLNRILDLLGVQKIIITIFDKSTEQVAVYDTPELTVKEIFQAMDTLKEAGFIEREGEGVACIALKKANESEREIGRFESLCELAEEVAKGGTRMKGHKSMFDERLTIVGADKERWWEILGREA